MSRIKTTNQYQQIGVGFDSQWIHLGASLTSRVTITPKAGEIVVLIKAVVNTSGSSSPTVFTDSATGMIASVDPTTSPGRVLAYNLPMAQGGKLMIDNTGGADITVVFRDR